MTTLKKLTLLPVVCCALLLPAHSQEVVNAPAPKSLPMLVDPAAHSLLKQGEFQKAEALCSEKIQARVLVSEGGELAGPF